MAKVHGPLLSMGASGTVAHAVTFLQRHGDTIAFTYTRKRDFKTPAQVAIRDRFRWASTMWPFRSPSLEQALQAAAVGEKLTAWNIFVRWVQVGKVRPWTVGTSTIGGWDMITYPGS